MGQKYLGISPARPFWPRFDWEGKCWEYPCQIRQSNFSKLNDNREIIASLAIIFRLFGAKNSEKPKKPAFSRLHYINNIHIFSFKNTDFERKSLNNTWDLLYPGVRGPLDSLKCPNHSKFSSNVGSISFLVKNCPFSIFFEQKGSIFAFCFRLGWRHFTETLFRSKEYFIVS